MNGASVCAKCGEPWYPGSLIVHQCPFTASGIYYHAVAQQQIQSSKSAQELQRELLDKMDLIIKKLDELKQD